MNRLLFAVEGLPSAKITEIKQFTPSQWAKAQSARLTQAVRPQLFIKRTEPP